MATVPATDQLAGTDRGSGQLAGTDSGKKHMWNVGFWNMGWQSSMFQKPHVHLPKLVDLCKLWIEHNLDALCLCELGDHLNGLPGYELTLEATIRQFVDNECRQGGVLEPDLCFIWGNGKSSAQLADTRDSDERMGSSYVYIPQTSFRLRGSHG